MAQSSLQPLSVGNVVTTGFQLYKNRFKSYFLLALKAYFWLLIPVYGWAKFLAISALISRLVYGELINQPEAVAGGTKYINSKVWQFFLTFVLFIFIALIVWIILYIVFIIIGVIVVLVFGGSASSLQTGSVRNTVLVTLSLAISFIGAVLILIRFFVLELPLAIEHNMNATSAIRRSWILTKSFKYQIISIYFVSFLTTLPLLALSGSVCSLILGFDGSNFLIAYPLITLITLANIIYRAFQFLSGGTIDQDTIVKLLFSIFALCLSILSGAIQLPFWQAVKAVVYYDLRTRKEGLGLKLRDRNI